MTSSYSEKVAKLKNALENVFVKKTDIKDNLTSTDTNKPLSANQGKILDTNKVDKISGKSLSTNDFTNTYKTKLDNLDTLLENKANNTHTHGNLQNDGSIGTSNNVNKNVITDGNGKITTEDKPTIPSASSTVPSADTSSGSYGSGTTYARANHQHPKSSLYAETSHTHTKSEITNFTHTHSISDITTLQTTLNGKANTSHTHTTSEITDFPVIPDVSNYIQKSSTSGLVKNDGSIDSNDYVTSQELPSKTSDLINDSSFTTLQAVYPVGSIYMSVNNVSPSTLFGFGVWEKIEDKFLLASGTTFEDGSTGGSADSVVVSHNHTQNSHTHKARS